jgi:hypothetical protein
MPLRHEDPSSFFGDFAKAEWMVGGSGVGYVGQLGLSPSSPKRPLKGILRFAAFSGAPYHNEATGEWLVPSGCSLAQVRLHSLRFAVGDHLWVREAWAPLYGEEMDPPDCTAYRADGGRYGNLDVYLRGGAR